MFDNIKKLRLILHSCHVWNIKTNWKKLINASRSVTRANEQWYMSRNNFHRILIERSDNLRVLSRIFDRIIPQRCAPSILYITRLNQYFFNHRLFYYFRSNNIPRNKISKNIMLDKNVHLQCRIISINNKNMFTLTEVYMQSVFADKRRLF